MPSTREGDLENLGKRTFANLIKSRRGQTGQEWALNPMTGVFVREGSGRCKHRDRQTDKQTEGRMQWRQMRDARDWQRPTEARRRPPGVFRERSGQALRFRTSSFRTRREHTSFVLNHPAYGAVFEQPWESSRHSNGMTARVTMETAACASRPHSAVRQTWDTGGSEVWPAHTEMCLRVKCTPDFKHSRQKIKNAH